MGPLLPLAAWVRSPSLRSWPVLVFIMLVTIPPVAIVVFYNNPGLSAFDVAVWILAAYFALAWLLLIGVIVRPAGISMLLLVLVVAVALVTQVPLAITLEQALHSGNSNLFTSVFTIGVPEELAKAIPVIVIALVARDRLMPADYLFLGAVSGLAFGASEAEHYLANGAGIGHGATSDLVTALEYVWRFPTDPISHACWAGITGYFIGLAVTGRYKWFSVSWLGLAMASILHGLNDWNTLNGHWGWIAVVVISGLLFLTYAKADPAAVSPAGKAGGGTAPVTMPGRAPTRAVATAQDVEAQLAALKRQLPGNADDRQAP